MCYTILEIVLTINPRDWIYDCYYFIVVETVDAEKLKVKPRSRRQ